jgi:hypothetical protein
MPLPKTVDSSGPGNSFATSWMILLAALEYPPIAHPSVSSKMRFVW